MAASLPSNLTPAQFTAATGNAPTPAMSASQLATQNAVQAQNASPAGAVQTPYNFVPVVPGQQVNTPSVTPAGTLNANISTPASNNTTVNPPAVLSSTAAQNDLANVGSQLSTLNQDVNNQSAAVSANSQANSQGSQSTASPTANNTGGSSTSSPDSNSLSSVGGSFDDQISSLLNDLTSNTQTIQQNATTEEGGLLDAQSQNLIDQNNSYAQTASQLQAIQSGVYPLNPMEQQLLSATAAVFGQTIAAQNTANQAYTGQMAEAMASLGINTSAPTEAMGNIQAAISSGQSKVAALDATMAQSLAQLQIGFQQQDFSMVQGMWADASQQFTQRTDAINSMLSTVQTEAANQISEIQNQTSTAISAYNSSATFDLSKAMDMISTAQKQQQITETQRSDLANEAIAAANASKGVYSMTPTGQILDSRTGQIVGQQSANAALDPSVIGNTGNPLVDNNTKTALGGIPYVDGTNLTGAAADAAQMTAAENGIPYMGATQSAALNKLADAKNNLDAINAQIQPLLGGGVGGHIFQGMVANNIGAALQSNAKIAAFNTWRSAAIGALQALAGGSGSGLRINQAEIQMSVAQDIPTITDSVQVAQQKLNVMNTMLNDQERSLFGAQTYDSFNPTAAATDLSTFSSQSASNTAAVTSARQAYPNATPYQIMQIVGDNPSS